MKLLLTQQPNKKWVGILTWNKQVWHHTDEYDTKAEAEQAALHFRKDMARWWK